MSSTNEVTILLIGPSKSGKSSLATRLKDDTFDPFADQPTKPRTLSFNFKLTNKLLSSQPDEIKLNIIDTTNKADVSTMENYIEFADAVMFTHEYYSNANVWSDMLLKWCAKIQSVKCRQVVHTKVHADYIPFALVCTKFGDAVQNRVPSNGRIIEKKDAKLLEMFMIDNKQCIWDTTKYSLGSLYFQCSSETGENVHAPFNHLINQVFDQRREMNALIQSQKKSSNPSRQLFNMVTSKSNTDDLVIL